MYGFKKRGNEKTGQVTIFIIIGVLIVALAVLIYLLFPNINQSQKFDSENPSSFIQSCLEDKIKESIDILSPQGGEIDPPKYFLYQGEKISYVCYTNQYYDTCVVQKPLLDRFVENEIKEYINLEVQSCFNSLKL